MRRLALTLVMVSFPFLTLSSNRPVGRSFATRSEVIARHGMAATSQPLATQVALDILKQGGTAVDAAIAANALMGLVEPTGNGMGGDLFAIVWDAKTKKLHGLHASGRSPYGLTLEHFRKLNLKTVPKDGPLPVSVPGCVDGWFELHERFGRLPIKTLLAPATKYASEGFPVSEVIAEDWQKYAPLLEKWPGFKEVFMPQGQAPARGEFFHNPDLAKTFEKVAAGGRDAFYNGEIARAIAGYMKRYEGFLTEKDFADHHSEWVEPVSINYRGYHIWELPPNTQGIAALQILNILEGYDIKGMGFGSTEYVHHFIEAKKLAFEDSPRFNADPAFQKNPIKEIISKENAAQRRKLIDSTKAAKTYEAGEPKLDQADTIYLTVADADGNMISLIQS